MPSALPVFYYRLVKRSRMFYKRHRRPLCRYRSPAISPSSAISMQISIGSKEHTWMAGGCLFSRSASQPTRSEFENRTRIPRIGRDESGGSTKHVHTHGGRYPHDGSAGDWFYRSTKCDVHARRRRYINNVNYIPVAWVTVSCALSPLLVLFSSADVARAYKSNYLATYLSGGERERISKNGRPKDNERANRLSFSSIVHKYMNKSL